MDTLGDWSSITRIVGQMVDAGDGQSDAVDFDGVWTMTEEDSSSTLQERKVTHCDSFLSLKYRYRILENLSILSDAQQCPISAAVERLRADASATCAEIR